eukprot:TRINITY_DN55140_c0_g1_i1.p1 TRINITY_DN55140_c0_g1~~TRINITY_DN55140_c0_g1_i1.p1  ORF type:complete len:311 (-),score=71.07 TRINITY_DN55140_c0_g1_i1:336-1268(-)
MGRAHLGALCLWLSLGSFVALAAEDDTTEVRALLRHRRLTSKVTVDQLYFGSQAANEPPGTKCAPYLFTGEFACCYIYKAVARNYYSMYRYACNSNPDNSNCDVASRPGDTVTTKFIEPHACRRTVEVTRTFHVGLAVTNISGNAEVAAATSLSDVKVAVVTGLTTMMNITLPCVTLVAATKVSPRPPGGMYVTTSFKFKIDTALETKLSEAKQAKNAAQIDAVNGTITNAQLAIDGMMTPLMRSDEAALHWSLAFRRLGGDYDNATVDNVDLNVSREEKLGNVYVDAATRPSLEAVGLLLFLALALHGL